MVGIEEFQFQFPTCDEEKLHVNQHDEFLQSNYFLFIAVHKQLIQPQGGVQKVSTWLSICHGVCVGPSYSLGSFFLCR